MGFEHGNSELSLERRLQKAYLFFCTNLSEQISYVTNLTGVAYLIVDISSFVDNESEYTRFYAGKDLRYAAIEIIEKYGLLYHDVQIRRDDSPRAGEIRVYIYFDNPLYS